MLNPWPDNSNWPNHEELFMQHYQWLLGWALRMTEQNREQAEDLVHDCFVHFTISRPSLAAIEANLQGYLYTMLRNLHLSHVRRATRLRDTLNAVPDSSLLDFDSVEYGLKALEQQAQEQLQLQLQDELWRICEYACTRKATSKAGSVLLLRFIHGYYPLEIAAILKSTRGTVDELLRTARSEARVYLSNPTALSFVKESPPSPSVRSERNTEDFLFQLSRSIWNSRKADGCSLVGNLKATYQDESSTIDTGTLAHLVSCESCLEEVNRLLDLPLLSARYPMNTLGRDRKSKDKEGGGGLAGGGSRTGGGSDDGFLKRSRKRRQDVLNHRPKELRISVNGFVIGSHQISSRINKQAVSVNVDEKIGFVEIFSEREVRLLFCSINMPPDGPVEHKERVDLSDGRTLEMTLSFDEPWPALNVVYEDPEFSEERVSQLEGPPPERSGDTVPNAEFDDRDYLYQPRSGFLLNAWRHFVNLGTGDGLRVLLRPGVVTALVAVVLVAALLFMYLRSAPTTATQLLSKSAGTEEADLVPGSDVAVHRTINLEERLTSGELIAQSRIDIWQSASNQTGNVKAKRVYDEKNQLVAGAWTKRDGSRVIFHHGLKPQLQSGANGPIITSLDSESIWHLELSARTFAAVVSEPTKMVFEERPNSYLISYQNDARSGDSALVRAALVINKSDLHATEETLVVRRVDELHEYRFIETGYARHPISAVAPGVFEPDSGVLGSGASNNSPTSAPTGSPASVASTSTAPITATAELEVEVVGLLNRVNAFLGEQISVNRPHDGAVEVNAIVETDKRKKEILEALSPVANNPAVRIRIETVAEAAEREEARQAKSPAGATTLNQIEVAQAAIPAEPELRSYLSRSKQLAGTQLEDEIRFYSERVMVQSQRARAQALALKQIVERFSLDDLRMLSPEARAKWLSMVHERAGAFQRDYANLRRELEPLFPGVASVGGGASEIDMTNDARLAQAVKRLYELAAANDEAVSRSFSIYVGSMPSTPVKQSQFWRSLRNAESLAARIASFR